MRRFWNIAPVLLVLCIGSGCAASKKTIPDAEAAAKQKQEETLRVMLEQIDRNAATIRTGQTEIASLQQRLKDLEARIDSSLASENAASTELRENVSFLTTQVQRLDNSLREQKPPERKPAPKTAGVFKPGGYNVEAAYREALAAYRARKFDAAISAFTEIMTMAPTSSLADNAQYWIGESYYSMRNYEKALQAFTRVLTFQNTNKAADAHLKIGMIYTLMDNNNAAREELNLVIKDYPNSDAAKVASKKLESLGK